MCYSAIVSVCLHAVCGYALDMCVQDDWQDFLPAWFKCIDVLAEAKHTKKEKGGFLVLGYQPKCIKDVSIPVYS